MALEQMGALATGWLSLFCLAAGIFGSISALGAAWAARWFVRRPASSTPMRWPDISILKPLSGIEARLSENIETYFNQDYPGIYAKANVPRASLKAMRDGGLRLLLVGYETGNQQILYNIKKGMRIDVAKRFTKDCRDLGIVIHGTFIMGLPGETQETIRETIAFAKEVNPHTLQVSLAAPYPGTHLYKQAIENGWLDDANAELVDENGVQMAPLHYPGLSHAEIFDSVETFYRSFYLRPAKIASIVGEMVMSPDMMKRRLREGAEFFRFLRERRAAAH